MPGETIYLIDTNSLVTPKATYYPLDLAPTFWASMAEKIQDGSIAILDLVKKEILKPKEKDDLALWITELNIGQYINHRQQEIVTTYANVLQSIQDDPCYLEKALRSWADQSVADPWLIATAAVYGYTIVTFEKFVNVNTGNPSGTPKIPNIAEKFHVRTTDLFHMIRDLGVRLLKLVSNIDDHSVFLNCFLLANGQVIALTTNLVILAFNSEYLYLGNVTCKALSGV